MAQKAVVMTTCWCNPEQSHNMRMTKSADMEAPTSSALKPLGSSTPTANLCENTTTAQKSSLLALPEELQAKIYRLAVTHDGPIKPEIWLPGDSQFAHDSIHGTWQWGQVYRTPARTGPNRRLPEALTGIELNFTCGTMYRIVDGDNLFYQFNQFEFRNTVAMLDYVKSLLTRRRQALRNISVLWDMSAPAPAFTALSLCGGLRNLFIDITLLAGYFPNAFTTNIDQAPGCQQLVTLRGMTSLNLTYGRNGSSWDLVHDILTRAGQLPITTWAEDLVQIEIAEIEASMNDLVTSEREPASLPSARELAQALRQSSVLDGDIYSHIPAPHPTTTSSEPSTTHYDESGNNHSPQAAQGENPDPDKDGISWTWDPAVDGPWQSSIEDDLDGSNVDEALLLSTG